MPAPLFAGLQTSFIGQNEAQAVAGRIRNEQEKQQLAGHSLLSSALGKSLETTIRGAAMTLLALLTTTNPSCNIFKVVHV